MFLKLYYYLIVSCVAYPEIADETCPLNYAHTNTERWLYTKIPGRLHVQVMYTKTGLVPTGVLNPFRSIYTSYPDLVHLLCVTRSTALRPLNVPSAFSHEPLILNTCMPHTHIIISFFCSLFLLQNDITIYLNCYIYICKYNKYTVVTIIATGPILYRLAYRNCFSWRTTDNPVCGYPETRNQIALYTFLLFEI